jgi:hypothetical protein
MRDFKILMCRRDFYSGITALWPNLILSCFIIADNAEYESYIYLTFSRFLDFSFF